MPLPRSSRRTIEAAASPKICERRGKSKRLRKGVSTNFHDRIASNALIMRRETRRCQLSASMLMYFANANRGQCQRYSAYEISPINTAGFKANIRLTAVGLAFPEKMINAAPRQGGIAARPGNTVSRE